MKQMHCNPKREEECRIVYHSGSFAYEFVADYAKNLPKHLTYASVAGGTCDQDDNLYLCVRGTANPIVKLDQEGSYVGEFGGGLIASCHFMTATPENTIVISNMPRHCFREIDQDGRLVRDFGTFGVPGDSGFNFNHYREMRRAGDIWPPEPYVRIPELIALTVAYDTVEKLGTPFNFPTDAAQNSKGEFFFSDGYGNVAVHRFTRDGQHVKTWGGKGDEPGKFLMVHSITVDKNDHIWVCDRDQNAVHVFDEDGNVLAYCKGWLGQPSGIVADKEYIYCVGRGGYLTVFTPDFKIAAQFGYFNSELRAHGIAVNSKGDLFLFPTTATEDHQCIQLKKIQ